MHKNEVIEFYEGQKQEFNGESLPDTASDKVHAERMAFLEERLGAEVCQALVFVANWEVSGE